METYLVFGFYKMCTLMMVAGNKVNQKELEAMTNTMHVNHWVIDNCRPFFHLTCQLISE